MQQRSAHKIDTFSHIDSIYVWSRLRQSAFYGLVLGEDHGGAETHFRIRTFTAGFPW